MTKDIFKDIDYSHNRGLPLFPGSLNWLKKPHLIPRSVYCVVRDHSLEERNGGICKYCSSTLVMPIPLSEIL